MRRVIDGFHQDAVGDWVAELSCLHNQHVRHQPPFQDRAWVSTESGRRARIGAPIDCPLCDRTELPDGLVLTRTAGPFDARTLPAGLQRDHRVAEHTWGLLRVRAGSARIVLATEPRIDRVVRAGDTQPIPPGVAHSVAITDGEIEVDFFVAAKMPA